MTDESKNVALTAWLGGWLAGPLPAFVVLFISRQDRGSWHHRKSVHAAVFWSVLTLAWLSVIVIDVGFRSGPNTLFFVGWGITVVSAVSATIISVVQIVQRGKTTKAVPTPV